MEMFDELEMYEPWCNVRCLNEYLIYSFSMK